MKRVFITRRLPPVAREMLAGRFEVAEHTGDGPLPRERLAEVVASHDAVLSTVADRFDRELLQRADRLRAISNYAIGLDNVDLAVARERGIAVYNLPDIVTESTADMTLALLLAFVRRVPEARDFVRAGSWTQWDPWLLVGEELAGKTLGILGYGRIGRAVARRAAGFGLRVLYAQRPDSPATPAGDGPRGVGLDELLAESDYLTLHLPLTAETRGLVDLGLIRRMRKRPLLLNLARGGVVVTADLVQALESGLLRGAALDVTDPEPIPAGHPLTRLPNCLVVPHIGTSTRECREAMARGAAAAILRHFESGNG